MVVKLEDLIELRRNCQRRLSFSESDGRTPTHCSSRSGNGSLPLIEHEFEELQKMSKEVDLGNAASDGLSPENWRKNRYRDIVPFNFNRVRLTIRPGRSVATDYVNASYIKLPLDVLYIAAQGPSPRTSGDFLRMVWEQQIDLIVCAVNEIENEQSKCQRYWPNTKKEEYRTKYFTLQLVKEPVELRCRGHLIFRHLRIVHVKTNEWRLIHHYHFIQWPDHGVPNSTEHVLHLLESVNAQASRGPVLIHCSAGCGRTGTIIAINNCIKRLQEGRHVKDVNILDLVKSLRSQRIGMVQTQCQYRFIYQAVADLIDRILGIDTLPDNNSFCDSHGAGRSKQCTLNFAMDKHLRRNRAMTMDSPGPKAALHYDAFPHRNGRLFLTTSRPVDDRHWSTTRRELLIGDRLRLGLFNQLGLRTQQSARPRANEKYAKTWNAFPGNS